MYAIALLLGRTRPVGEPRGFGVRRRSHRRPDLDLLVPLDRGFGGTAPFLAPYQRDLLAGSGVLDIHHAQRNHRPLIIGVTGVSRQTDDLSALDHFEIG